MTDKYSSLSRAELLTLLSSKDEEITHLKQKLCDKKIDSECIKLIKDAKEDVSQHKPETSLSKPEIARYSRQLILPELGVQSQLRLKNSSVLIVGAGGLGCPASIYLAAAGVGKIGVIDYDDVELSNLHRQISHAENRIGFSKALSIALSCKSLNSSVTVVPYHLQFNSLNALQIIKGYDIILDATDNVATRYLLNDACVLAGKPLVSGSALRFEGQLTVYNCDGGPCYRCLFPKPPPPETVTNCSEGGVLGVVPGIIGSLQALEAIKIITGSGSSYRQRLLLFDAMDGTFRSVKLRPRSVECAVCGDNPSLVQLIDYEQFCGARATDKDQQLSVLEDSSRIRPQDYADMLTKGTQHLLIDVRPEVEIDICKLPGHSLNIPLPFLEKNPEAAVNKIHQEIQSIHPEKDNNSLPVVCVCRRGNFSQLAVEILQKQQISFVDQFKCHFVDIKGGLHGWAQRVDEDFPVY